jgi:hypothetical protein
VGRILALHLLHHLCVDLVPSEIKLLLHENVKVIESEGLAQFRNAPDHVRGHALHELITVAVL